MTLEDAIKEMADRIKTACPSAEIKAVKMSDEEARLSVFAPAGDMQKIKDMTFQPAMPKVFRTTRVPGRRLRILSLS